MLNNFIGGGQIFLHNIRMFFQVLHRSFMTAFLISIAVVVVISYKSAMRLDLVAAVTYQKAMFTCGISDAFSGMRLAINPRSKNQVSKIDAYDKYGIYARDIDAAKVLKSRHFQQAYTEVIAFLKLRLIMLLVTMTVAFIVIYLLWSKFGSEAKAKKMLSGTSIKTAKEVARYLKRHKKISNFNLGGVPLVKDSEVKHILITGSTGSGKTNCIHHLLPQIRAAKQPAIVVDTEGVMVSRYYRPNKDIIINPFDIRTHNWDFWEEVKTNMDLKKVASSVFPDSPPDINDYDKKWNNWGRMLFEGSVEYLKLQGDNTIENLYNLIHKEHIDTLTRKLKNTSVGALLGSNSTNNAAPHNIRINALLATEWLGFIPDTVYNKFCFKNWLNKLDVTNDDSWVFLTCNGGDTKVLLPFISVLTDIAINCLINLGPSPTRRMWFVFDELAKLKYLPALQENIVLLRKYGGCVLAATQSLKQIFSHYGKNTGSVMIGQFNTNVMFRIFEVDEAQILAKRIGEVEYLTHQKNTSYGAHEFRDGISYTEQEKKEALIKPSPNIA